MSPTLYRYAIFFAVLFCVISLFQSVLSLRLGAQTYFLESFVPWFVCANLVSVTGLFLVLIYYRFQKFAFSFWALIGFIGATIFQFFVFLGLLMGSRQLQPLYLPAVLLSLASSLVYSASLMTKPAGARFWLKCVGVFGAVLGLVMIVTLIWSMSPPAPEKNSIVERIFQWTSLIGSVGPLMFVMNFNGELKTE